MTLNIEDGNITAKDVFRVEEAYSWRDDIMEITRRIVHEADEARLSNIAEHFEVDLSEIREYINMKQRRNKPKQTNADRIRAMTDEELAGWMHDILHDGYILGATKNSGLFIAKDEWLTWLKQEVTDNSST